MREPSPYQGMYDRTGIACLGQVRNIDSESRRLRVNTIGMPGGDDLDLHNVRILHGMWHAEGDEEVALPRVNTYGVIMFIGSEAFWMGACPLDMSSGEKQRTNQVDIDPGDKLIKTIAGNRIIVRSGGTIEIQAAQSCRTFWIPSQNLINSVCQNFELETAGGHLKWRMDKKSLDTNLQLKVWNSVSTTDNGVTMDIGTIPPSNEEVSNDTIKPYAVGDLIFDFKQGTLDDKLKFAKRSLRMSIKKDGSLFFDIGPSKFTLTVDAITGDVNFETKGSVKGLVKKDVELSVEGAVTATVKKDITLNAEANVIAHIKNDMTATIDGKASVSAKGDISVNTDSNANLTAKGNVVASAGGDASVTAAGKATISGTGGTSIGSTSSDTSVSGTAIDLGDGGLPVARMLDQAIGIDSDGGTVVSTIEDGSPKVTA